jgi:hypothetical protein
MYRKLLGEPEQANSFVLNASGVPVSIPLPENDQASDGLAGNCSANHRIVSGPPARLASWLRLMEEPNERRAVTGDPQERLDVKMTLGAA